MPDEQPAASAPDPTAPPRESAPPPRPAPPYGWPPPGAAAPYGWPAPPGPGLPAHPVGYATPPRRVRGRTIALFVALGLVVVIAVGVGAAFAVIRIGSGIRGDKGPAAAGRTTLVAPDRIGPFVKLDDERIDDFVDKEGRPPFAAAYGNPAQADQFAVVLGSTGRNEIPEYEAAEFFQGARDSVGEIAGIQTVDSGLHDGVARCGTARKAGVNMTVCVWVGLDALVGFVFTERSLHDSAALLLTMVPAVVHRE